MCVLWPAGHRQSVILGSTRLTAVDAKRQYALMPIVSVGGRKPDSPASPCDTSPVRVHGRQCFPEADWHGALPHAMYGSTDGTAGPPSQLAGDSLV
jgi:hypothetical protein